MDPVCLEHQDTALLVIAPALGLLGSVVRALTIRNSLEVLPTRPTSNANKFDWRFFYSRFNWYFAWAIVGCATGLLIGLLFSGSMASGFQSLARVGAMALISGFAAPSVWKKKVDL